MIKTRYDLLGRLALDSKRTLQFYLNRLSARRVLRYHLSILPRTELHVAGVRGLTSRFGKSICVLITKLPC